MQEAQEVAAAGSVKEKARAPKRGPSPTGTAPCRSSRKGREARKDGITRDPAFYGLYPPCGECDFMDECAELERMAKLPLGNYYLTKGQVIVITECKFCLSAAR